MSSGRGNEVDLVEADRNLRQNVSDLEEIAERFNDQRAHNALDNIRDDLERIETEFEGSERYNENLRRATYNAFNNLADDLENVANHLEQYDSVTINYDNLVGGDVVINEPKSRRGMLKWLGLAGLVFGTSFAANELSDEYDVDIGYDGPWISDSNQGSVTEDPDGDQEAVERLGGPLDTSEYDFVITEEDLIEEIGDYYENFSNEVGDLGTEIIEEYNDTSYQRLTLGYHDDSEHVQMKDLGENLMVNFGFEDSQLYNEAKEIAQEVDN